MPQLKIRSAACNQRRWFDGRRRTACTVRPKQATAHSGATASAPAAGSHPPPQPPVQPPSPALAVSQRIASARAIESRRRADGAEGDDSPLFQDPYAELLAGWRVTAEVKSEARQELEATELETALDVIATVHVDRLLLNVTAISADNRITQGDYRQVVLLGDAMDTRPFRLPLAPGTAIFLVAPAEVHAVAAAALASEEAVAIADAMAATITEVAAAPPPAAATAATAGSSGGNSAGGVDGEEEVATASGHGSSEGPGLGAGGRGGRSRSMLRGPRPPPGCLLRRVPLELRPGGDFSSLPSKLEAAGFLPDRLSVWAVQGLAGLGLDRQDVSSLLAEAANCAAYHSLMLGELPPLAEGHNGAANALAECGLLGAPMAFGTPDSSYGRWRPEWTGGGSGSGGGGDAPSGPAADPAAAADAATAAAATALTRHGQGQAQQRWLFAAQQVRLSGAQMDTYAAHRTAAEEMDEDFFDNFS